MELHEAIEGLVKSQDEVNKYTVDGIKLLIKNMIEVMEQIEIQNEAIRELQKIVYEKTES